MSVLESRRKVSTKELSYSEWQVVRKKSLGGSDIASVLGLSKFRGKLALYWEKVSDELQEDKEIFEWGRRLEPVVVQKFADSHPDWKVESYPYIVYGDNEWESANLDSIITLDDGTLAILEIKTTDVSNSSDWQDDKVPEYYITQIQWYMGITGIHKGFFGCLIGGNKYVEKEIDFNPRLFELMQEAAKSYWNNHIITGIPPHVDSSNDAEVVKSMYPADRVTDTVVPIGDIEYILGELEEVNKVVSEYTERKAILEGRIKEHLGFNARGESSRFSVGWIVSKAPVRVDGKKLKESFPDIYNRVTTQGDALRRLSIKRKVL